MICPTVTNPKLPCHLYHVSVRSLPRQPVRTVRTAQSASLFFACLTIRTDRNISHSRRLFEPKRVALGS
jgi:hypothetical protein